MRRAVFAFVAVILPGLAAAQDLVIPKAAYPNLPAKARSAEGFAPPGWVVEASVEGDLNGDGRPDLALVLRQSNPAFRIDHDGLGEKPLDTNPRLLAVAFRQAGEDYALALSNHTLIPRREIPAAEDHFSPEDLSIARGTLRVRLSWFMSAGSYETFSVTYTFRHQANRFELIGYDRTDVHRGSGGMTEISINYLTGRMKTERGTIEDDEKKVSWQNLPQRAPPTLAQVGDGLQFRPKL
ncbi:MAG TPA: hypothetical protein VIL09_03015 [Microvirga sp.]|jgi:hypothetical protein